MKPQTAFLVVAGLIAGALTTSGAQALSQSLAEAKNCADITIGATAVPTTTCMGGTGSSLIIQNESTSCIRVGGSAVTASTGISVGDGCAAGQVISWDVKRAWLIREGGADVTGVDVAWGDL